jgi:hypothetical protein
MYGLKPPAPWSMLKCSAPLHMFPGGVLGYGLTTFPEFGGQPIVGFDMGGTSTGGWLEVSLMDAINLFTL